MDVAFAFGVSERLAFLSISALHSSLYDSNVCDAQFKDCVIFTNKQIYQTNLNNIINRIYIRINILILFHIKCVKTMCEHTNVCYRTYIIHKRDVVFLNRYLVKDNCDESTSNTSNRLSVQNLNKLKFHFFSNKMMVFPLQVLNLTLTFI